MPTDPGSTLPDPLIDASLNQLWAELHDAVSVADAAVERATNRCLEGTGFEYQVPSRDLDFRAERTQAPWRFSLEQESDEQPASDEPQDDRLEPAFEQALYGDVVGEWKQDPADGRSGFLGAPMGGEIYDGCLPNAQLDIIGGGDPARSAQLIDFYYLLADIEGATVRRVISNPAYEQAHTEWRSCIESLGYSPTRFEPDDTILEEPAPLTAAEVDAANACSDKVGMTALGEDLMGTELRATWDRQQGLIEEFRTSLREVEQRALAE